MNRCSGLGWPSFPGLSSILEVPDDHHDPSAALISVTPVFTGTERLALAGSWPATAAWPRHPGCVTDRDQDCGHESPAWTAF
ncbi:MAG TPA: hypothetical protein VH589_18045 [Trebonia sp.]